MNREPITKKVILEDKTPPISYWHRPGGQAVVFVHGWLSSGSKWLHLFGDIPEEYSVLAPDLPGHGQSPPLPREMITLDEYTRLLGLFLKQVPQSPVRLVAADSLGAILILRLMQQGETLAPRILLSGCPFRGLPWFLFFTSFHPLDTFLLKLPHVVPEPVGSWLLKVGALSTVRRINDVNQVIVDDAMNADPLTGGILLEQLHNPGIDPKALGPAGRKIAVLRGKDDLVVSEKTGWDLSSILECPYREIPGTGHTPMMERPGEYTGALLELDSE